MTTLAEFCERLSDALHVPLGEVKSVARHQRLAGLQPPGGRRAGAPLSVMDGARLLVGVMVMRIEGAATKAKALTADIERLTHLSHGALLYLDEDFILPEDFIGAVGEILAALGDGARRERIRSWIGQIGLARGAGRMAGWIEVRSPGAEEWEDFDFAASAEDVVAIVEDAPVVRRIEVRPSALGKVAAALDGEGKAAPASKPSAPARRKSPKRAAAGSAAARRPQPRKR